MKIYDKIKETAMLCLMAVTAIISVCATIYFFLYICGMIKQY